MKLKLISEAIVADPINEVEYGDYAADIDSLPAVEPEMRRLYRGRSQKTGSKPSWIAQSPEFINKQKAFGRWWAGDPKAALWYTNDASPHGEMDYIDVPEDVYKKHHLASMSDETKAELSAQGLEPWKYSRDSEGEWFLPPEYINKGNKVQVRNV